MHTKENRFIFFCLTVYMRVSSRYGMSVLRTNRKLTVLVLLQPINTDYEVGYIVVRHVTSERVAYM